MTTPDVKAIRAQMEALAGHTSGPWHYDLGETYRAKSADGMNIATANWVTLLGRLPSAEVKQNIGLIAAAPDMRDTILALCDALDAARLCVSHANLHADCAIADMAALRAENERLREAAEHFATWDQCWPGNINLKGACEKIRAALAQQGGEA